MMKYGIYFLWFFMAFTASLELFADSSKIHSTDDHSIRTILLKKEEDFYHSLILHNQSVEDLYNQIQEILTSNPEVV